MYLPDGPRLITFFIKYLKSQHALPLVLNKIGNTVIGVTVKNYTEVYNL